MLVLASIYEILGYTVFLRRSMDCSALELRQGLVLILSYVSQLLYMSKMLRQVSSVLNMLFDATV